MLRMMVDKTKAGNPGVEFVPHYSPDIDVRYIRHHFNCPHYVRQLDTERSPDCHPDCKHNEGLWMETSYVGKVLDRWERNGYDDSDFFALVWDDETNSPKTIEYGTTRAWTYPNCATVDATDAVLEKYRAWLVEATLRVMKAEDIERSKEPGRGKVCRVFKGRKIPVGTVVKVCRVYEKVYMRDRTTMAVVEFTLDGKYTQVHTNVENLEVINPDECLTPEAGLREAAVNQAAMRVEYLRCKRPKV